MMFSEDKCLENPYKELDVNKNANIDEIKSKFRELSKLHHPDVKGNPDKFIKIKLAYDVLCDPKRRELFDKEGIITDVNEDKQLQDSAKHNIVTLLKSIISNKNIMVRLDSVDLVKIMGDNVTANKIKITANIDEMGQQIQAIREVTERMECIEGDDLLTCMLEAEIKEKENIVKGMSNELKIIEHMNNLLKNYKYSFKNHIIHYINSTTMTGTTSY